MPKVVSPSQASWQFGNAVVAWQKQSGRHDLPWQNTQDPYAVWLSEIMLQQTQVVTVRDYYARFMQRFPTVADLAKASQEEVMGLWSGLGYYSRARNLHKAAQDVVALHGGKFPRDAQTLQTLSGIGRSTAAAIASLCFGEPVAILDANVKRVLTRYLGFKHDLALAKNEKLLWALAQTLLPTSRVAHSMPHYTQGMMDLGATVCTSQNPQCTLCPLSSQCLGAKEGKPENYPVKTKKLKRTSQQLWLLDARTQTGDVWLVQRPQSGIWAGLYCLPVFDTYEALQSAVSARHAHALQDVDVIKHVLTHKDLYLHPVRLTLHTPSDLGQGAWFKKHKLAAIGLPAPIRKLLEDV